MEQQKWILLAFVHISATLGKSTESTPLNRTLSFHWLQAPQIPCGVFQQLTQNVLLENWGKNTQLKSCFSKASIFNWRGKNYQRILHYNKEENDLFLKSIEQRVGWGKSKWNASNHSSAPFCSRCFIFQTQLGARCNHAGGSPVSALPSKFLFSVVAEVQGGNLGTYLE